MIENSVDVDTKHTTFIGYLAETSLAYIPRVYQVAGRARKKWETRLENDLKHS